MLDGQALFGKDLLHGQALDLLGEQFLCKGNTRGFVGHQDAPGLSPAADIHLRLQYKRFAQFVKMGGKFSCRPDEKTCRDGYPALPQDLFCLVFP